MKNRTELKDFYAERIIKYENLVKSYTSQSRIINLLRGVLFTVTAVSAIVVSNYSLAGMFAIIFVGIVLFAHFVIRANKVARMLDYTKKILDINKKERNCLDGYYADFDCGDEYKNPNHNYSSDLDIFGQNSLFQYVNRTTTRGGKDLLARRFQKTFFDFNVIKSIQNAVCALKNQTDIRQDFAAYGPGANKETQTDKLCKIDEEFKNPKLLKIFAIICCSITLISITAAFAGFLNPIIGGSLFFMQITISTIFSNKTRKLSSKVEVNSQTLSDYEMLFKTIERIENKPEYIQNLLNKASIPENPAQSINAMKKIAHGYELRMNLVFIIFAQGLFLYDIFLNLKFEKYIKAHASQIAPMFNCIYECDYIFSLANLYFNNPQYSMPQPVEEKFTLIARNAGHPLISPEKNIGNFINFSQRHYMLIITGANMAGKSTYLRTCGVNLILAGMGSAVCAESFEWSPVEIFTSIRAIDSVHDGQSYFYAELMRLKTLVNKLEAGETLFVIVDEMLRGTNSRDKHDGSEKFLRKILNYNCYGLFATHDVNIGTMEKDYPENIGAQCFEISFNENELIFDYTLRKGISQNLNASYLMEKYGIIE